jgi:hypothetical protein
MGGTKKILQNKKTKLSHMIELLDQIDLSNINIKLIKSNCKTLSKIFLQMKKIWEQVEKINYISRMYKYGSIQYLDIIKTISGNFLLENLKVKNIIENSTSIILYQYKNIKFYWFNSIDKNNGYNHEQNELNENTSNMDLIMSKTMFKITMCMNLFKYPNFIDNIDRIIIWIPISTERNYFANMINEKELDKSSKSFEAFVASGVTYSTSKSKITLVTRFEEVEKLLIHELVHNYNLDGSEYHSDFLMKQVVSQYKNIKNPLNYDYEYSIYESYTELVSTYFYLIFKNLVIKTTTHDIETKLFSQILCELLYSYNTISNIIKLNGYNSWNKFAKSNTFEGSICTYEYYYVKALAYNNLGFELGSKPQDFVNIYLQIIKMIKNIQGEGGDPLMKDIYLNAKTQTNFKYQLN